MRIILIMSCMNLLIEYFFVCCDMIIDCELVFDFVLDSVTYASTISANINSIPVLNGTNFKNWKENVMIVLDCMDLDLALQEERSLSLNENNFADENARMEK